MSRVLDMWAGMTGVVMDFAGATAPNGWLLCYGQVVNTADYPNLFTAIGTTYNTGGEAAGTFRLPDLRGRVGVGKDNMGGSAANRITSAGGGINGTTLGAAGGAETHTLTTAQMPAHTHANTLTDPGHSHSHNAAALTPSSTGGGGFQIVGYAGGTINANTTGITINNASQGSGGAHPNVQPGMVINKIIKT